MIFTGVMLGPYSVLSVASKTFSYPDAHRYRVRGVQLKNQSRTWGDYREGL